MLTSIRCVARRKLIGKSLLSLAVVLVLAGALMVFYLGPILDRAQVTGAGGALISPKGLITVLPTSTVAKYVGSIPSSTQFNYQYGAGSVSRSVVVADSGGRKYDQSPLPNVVASYGWAGVDMLGMQEPVPPGDYTVTFSGTFDTNNDGEADTNDQLSIPVKVLHDWPGVCGDFQLTEGVSTPEAGCTTEGARTGVGTASSGGLTVTLTSDRADPTTGAIVEGSHNLQQGDTYFLTVYDAGGTLLQRGSPASVVWGGEVGLTSDTYPTAGAYAPPGTYYLRVDVARDENQDANPDKFESVVWQVKVIGCGDGIVQADRGEECDDGNSKDGDGCSAECLLEQKCFILQCTPTEGEDVCRDCAPQALIAAASVPEEEEKTYEQVFGLFVFEAKPPEDSGPDSNSKRWVTDQYAAIFRKKGYLHDAINLKEPDPATRFCNKVREFSGKMDCAKNPLLVLKISTHGSSGDYPDPGAPPGLGGDEASFRFYRSFFECLNEINSCATVLILSTACYGGSLFKELHYLQTLSTWQKHPEIRLGYAAAATEENHEAITSDLKNKITNVTGFNMGWIRAFDDAVSKTGSVTNGVLKAAAEGAVSELKEIECAATQQPAFVTKQAK